MNLKQVDIAIKQALFENGPLFNNELHRQVHPICNCTEKTCRQHASVLAEFGEIKRKRIGPQKVEYSLNYDKNTLNSKLKNFLDELIEDAEESYYKVIKIVSELTKTKEYSELKKEEQFDFFMGGSDSIRVILRWYQLLLLLTIGGFGTSDIKQKARKLQKKYNHHLQELFQIYRKIDPSLARMIFSDVFDDLYPKEKRSEDSILI